MKLCDEEIIYIYIYIYISSECRHVVITLKSDLDKMLLETALHDFELPSCSLFVVKSCQRTCMNTQTDGLTGRWTENRCEKYYLLFLPH